MQEVDKKFHTKAPLTVIERLENADRDLKVRFNAEFENMQGYLKDQNIK